MGSKGGSAPNPYTQRQLATLFLRVPVMDWPRVMVGEKTEFRTMPREGSRIISSYLPTPVIAYTVSGGPLREFRRRLMVLLEHRYEPLFAIAEDADALSREGFESYDLFRRYWRARRKGIYRPMERVHVWRVRFFEEKDWSELGAQLARRLYGEYADD